MVTGIEVIARVMQHRTAIDLQAKGILIGDGAAVVVDDGLDHRQGRRDVVVDDGAGGRLTQRQAQDGMNSLEGIYTDIGGNLSVIVDDDENNSIELGGQTEQITGLGFGPKSFVYTPQGYMIVFKAWFESGETAIIRATITVEDSPGVSTASPPTANFEDGNADGWLLNGNVAIDGILAIGQFSLRHGKSATSVLNVSTAGYDGVSVTMHLAATSLKKGDTCYAEVSTNGGNSWLPVIELQYPNDDSIFYSGTLSPPGADDNLNMQLRFRASGKGKKGYCYGDDVIVSGTLIGD